MLRTDREKLTIINNSWKSSIPHGMHRAHLFAMKMENKREKRKLFQCFCFALFNIIDTLFGKATTCREGKIVRQDEITKKNRLQKE